MNKSRVLLNFMSMNWKDLGPFGMLLSSILYTVAFFTDPPVTKAVLDAAIADLANKGFVTIRRCSTAQTNLRETSENNLKALLKKNADYVNMMSGGDRATIITSGYDVYTPEYNGSTTVFTVIQGAFSGQVVSDWPSDPDAHSYIFRYSVNTDLLRDIYTEVAAGTTGCTINGLVKGTEYAFSVASVYSGSQSPFCDPIILMVI